MDRSRSLLVRAGAALPGLIGGFVGARLAHDHTNPIPVLLGGLAVATVGFFGVVPAYVYFRLRSLANTNQRPG